MALHFETALTPAVLTPSLLERHEPLISPATGWIVLMFSFNKDGFDIK